MSFKLPETKGFLSKFKEVVKGKEISLDRDWSKNRSLPLDHIDGRSRTFQMGATGKRIG